jgi:hypothetical protein
MAGLVGAKRHSLAALPRHASSLAQRGRPVTAKPMIAFILP